MVIISVNTVPSYLGKDRTQEFIIRMEADRQKTDTRHMTPGVHSVGYNLRIYSNLLVLRNGN